MVSRQIKIGAVLNYVNMVFGFGFTIFITPLVIRSLGKEEFGLYCLIGALSGYLHLLQFGIGAVVVRYVAKYNAENDQRGRENFLGMIFLFHLLLSGVVLLTGILLTTQLENIFPGTLTSPAAVTKARVMVILVSLSLAVSFITDMFAGALSGCEEFVFPRLVTTVSWCSRIIATLAILTECPSAVAITALTTILAIFSGLVNTTYALRKADIRVKLHTWDASLVREVLVVALLIFLQQLSGMLYWRVGEMIVGMKMSAVQVGVYSIAMQLNILALTFSNSINNLLLPHATKLMVRCASVEDTTHFVAAVGRIILMLYGGIYLGFMFFGKSFIALWAGKGYEDAYSVTLIALSAAAIPRIQAGMNNVMQAKNMNGVPALIYALASALSVPLAWVLAERFGLIGIVCGTSLGLIVGNVILANIYYVKCVGLDLMLFLRETFSGIWMALLLASLVCYAVRGIEGSHLGAFLAQCTLYIAVYAAALLAFGFNKAERAELLTMAGKTRRLFGI